MTNVNAAQTNLDFRVIADQLADGILVFDPQDRLIYENASARLVLGANLTVISAQGWSALAVLFETRRAGGFSLTEARLQSQQKGGAVRFGALLNGVYLPCHATVFTARDGAQCTLVSIEQVDWTPLNELMSHFREESDGAISSTLGHAEMMLSVLQKRTPTMTADKLADRVSGFARLMASHMFRLQQLIDMLERLEHIRTGKLVSQVASNSRRIVLRDFFEDYLEELSTKPLVDPATKEDIRERLTLKIPGKLDVMGSTHHLKAIVTDLLRNAVQYSPADSPITLQAERPAQGAAVQIDIVDQGYGIRQREAERVFAPFQRARQPQIIAEFGYGLALYLARTEIEAMGGRIWFESEEGVGSTFSFKLPVWNNSATPSA